MAYLWIFVIVAEAAAATAGLLRLRKMGRKTTDLVVYGVLAGIIIAGTAFALGIVVEGARERSFSMGSTRFLTDAAEAADRIRLLGYLTALVPLGSVFAVPKIAEMRKGNTGSGGLLKQDIDGLTFRKVLVLVLALGGAFLGLISSQYFPAWGTIEKLGEPWSDARQSLIFGHVVAFAVLGAAIGVVALLLRLLETKKS